MHIVLVGPCAPIDVMGLLNPADSRAAAETKGYRGIPVSELAKSYVALGHRVSVATLTYHPDDEESVFRGPNFEVFVGKGRPHWTRNLPDAYRVERGKLSEYIRQTSADVTHAHWTYEFELAAQQAGRPHVTTAHDAPVTVVRHMRHPARVARLALAYRARLGIQHLSCVSPYLATRWRREMLYRGPVEVIPNSIPTDALSEGRRPTQHPTVLEVADGGRLKNVKGLLRAFAVTRQQIPDAALRIVGPGLDDNSATAHWARETNVAEGVTFVGPAGRQELGKEFEQAWLFSHASLEECCPMVVLEALGSHVPVVAGNDAGGTPYVLDYGRFGRLTDITEPTEYGRCMSAMLAEGPPSGPSGLDQYLDESFSPTAVAGRYIHWYERSLGLSEGG